MQKRGLTVIFVLALLTFIAIEQDPVLSVEPAYIELDSTILNGVDASQYGLTDQDAVMILTAKNKISFESFIKFSAESQKVFLNQCVQNSWTEFAGASQVYARFDYENKTYAYAIVTYLADSNSLSLRIFESGIDETQFKALVTKIPPAPQPEVKPEPQPDPIPTPKPEPKPKPAIPEVIVFTNVDYQKNPIIRVYADNQQVLFDVAPAIVKERTLVPMRAIFERFGLEVDWNAAAQTATGHNDDFAIVFTIGQNKAIVNEQEKELDVAASIMQDRTMIPLRFLSANMGYHVVWIGDSNLVLLSRSDIVEWRIAGYDTAPPYKEYAIQYVNGAMTDEVKYTGKTRPLVTITDQGFVTQMRGKFYSVHFSDGFAVAATIPKHKVAYTRYEAARISVDGTKLTKAIEPGTIRITGFNKHTAGHFRLSFTDYSAAIPEAIKKCYRERILFIHRRLCKDKEISVCGLRSSHAGRHRR